MILMFSSEDELRTYFNNRLDSKYFLDTCFKDKDKIIIGTDLTVPVLSKSEVEKIISSKGDK